MAPPAIPDDDAERQRVDLVPLVTTTVRSNARRPARANRVHLDCGVLDVPAGRPRG